MARAHVEFVQSQRLPWRGALADALGGPVQLGPSLAVMAGVFGVPSLVVLVAGAGAYRKALAARETGRG